MDTDNCVEKAWGKGGLNESLGGNGGGTYVITFNNKNGWKEGEYILFNPKYKKYFHM